MTLPITQKNISDSTNNLVEHRTINLRDLMSSLKYTEIYDLRRRFYTFCKKCKLPENAESYKSDTYIDLVNGKFVPTVVMTPAIAAAFSVYIKPDVGVTLMVELLQPKPEVSYNSLVFQPTIPFVWIVQALGRSTASTNRTVKLNIDRVQSTELEKHWCWKDGQRWFTPWFVANMMVCKADGMKLKALLTNLVETQQIESSVGQLLELPHG